jgi:hypothetical protein
MIFYYVSMFRKNGDKHLKKIDMIKKQLTRRKLNTYIIRIQHYIILIR